ncbi:MAG: purine-nucleoside phosphorylase [Pyramidobacter sp.]|nr:purine-nucleoside phosphorylase [Pyramidobacter sp.]
MNCTEYARQVTEALNCITSRTAIQPAAAIILGSGLGALADSVEQPVVIPYADIPGWKSSTAPGHAGRLVCGLLAGVPVVVMQGRLHGYEGYTPQETTFPVRVFGQWGVKILIVTNASGGINYQFTNGDLVLITDHINYTGVNPLIGENNGSWGPRFPDMTQAYSQRLIGIAEDAARDLGQITRRGVYIGFSGPSYETPAEIRMARAMGADLVGMSSVHEVIVARHIGMEVCGISCVANMAAGMRPVALTAEEVLAEMKRSARRFTALVTQFVKLIGQAR